MHIKQGVVPFMIELQEITWENFWQVINLKPSESQGKYLPSNSVFMAQAYVNLKLGYPDICFALCTKSQPVGFTKIVYVPRNVEPYYFLENSYMIDAIMIDVRYQGRGYGKEALYQVLKYVESKPFGEADSIKLLCHDDNSAAVSIYKEAGFYKTDKFSNRSEGFFIYSKDIKSTI